MPDLPLYIDALFIITVFCACYIFYRASNRDAVFIYVMAFWLLLQTVVSSTGFYTVTQTFPPRFALLLGIPVLFIIGMFSTNKGRVYIDSLDMKYLIMIHLVRIPVEIVLYLLFLYKKVPVGMTFEGANFDILSGITALIIVWLYHKKRLLSKKVLLVWNFMCLLLLLTIVVKAVFSAPFAFQQFAFEQPNVAVLYFPYVWLPCCVVPLVLFSHLAAIRKLLK